MKRGQVTLFIVLGLIIIVATGIYIYFSYGSVSYETDETVREQIGKVTQEDVLTDAARLVQEVEKSKQQIDMYYIRKGEEYHKKKKEEEYFKIFFVPINYKPDERDFLARIETYKAFIMESSNIDENNFMIVDKTYTPIMPLCPDPNLIQAFVDEWHQHKFGISLPPRVYMDRKPVNFYMVVGIDGAVQDPLCGCGYTNGIYSESIYIGGAECSRNYFSLMHEMGHSFGLCDEYDSCVYDETDKVMREVFGFGCPNKATDATNSDCGDECCSEMPGYACCFGKFVSSVKSGVFNVMGSSNVPPARSLNRESKSIVNGYLCDMFNICGGEQSE